MQSMSPLRTLKSGSAHHDGGDKIFFHEPKTNTRSSPRGDDFIFSKPKPNIKEEVSADF